MILQLAAPASAHIRLLEPQPRYTEREVGEGDFCPCGVVTGGRRCRQPAERSDPNRVEERATALLGGSSIRVRLEEYVAHSGRYRVAFDPDGADLDDFNAHVLTDIPDPEGNRGNTGEARIWEIEARLPNIDCDRCTLQVVQRADDDMQTPLLSPGEVATYFGCADLVLTRDPSLPEGYAEPRVVSNDTLVGGAAGSSATAAASGEPVDFSTPGPESSGGCSLGALGTARGVEWTALAGLVLLARRARGSGRRKEHRRAARRAGTAAG
jgi:hypothetical protein